MVYTSALYHNWWRTKGAAQSFTPPTRQLQLSDYVRRPGVEYAILAMFQADRTGDEIYDKTNSQGSLLAGDDDFNATNDVDRVRTQSSGDLILLHRDGPTAMRDLFANNGVFSDSPGLDIQTEAGLSNHPVLDGVGNTFVRFDNGTNDSIGDDIVDDDRFIIAIYYTPMMTLRRGFDSGFGLGFG